MTVSLNDFTVTKNWADLTAALPSASGVDVLIQNVTLNHAQVVAGGASAPVDKSGVILGPFESLRCNNAKIWAKSLDGLPGSLSVTLI